MSNEHFFVERGLWENPAFKKEPATLIGALIWIADKGRIVRAHISDLADAWSCAERRVAAIIKRLVKHGLISVHGSGAVRTLFIITDLIRTCGFHETGRARWKWRKGASKWRSGSISQSLRMKVIDRDGPVRAYCGRTDGPFHVDHIKPVCQGGLDAPNNLTVACRGCNLSKGGKSLKQWRARNES